MDYRRPCPAVFASFRKIVAYRRKIIKRRKMGSAGRPMHPVGFQNGANRALNPPFTVLLSTLDSIEHVKKINKHA